MTSGHPDRGVVRWRSDPFRCTLGKASPRGDTAQTMSQENVQTLRKAADAFRSRDAEALEALMDPDEYEFRSVLGAGGKVYRGTESIQEYFADIDDAFDDWRTEDEHYFDAGGDQAVIVYRAVGFGRESGVPIAQPVAIVWTFRNGRLLLGETYLDPHEAFEAAGLKE